MSSNNRTLNRNLNRPNTIDLHSVATHLLYKVVLPLKFPPTSLSSSPSPHPSVFEWLAAQVIPVLTKVLPPPRWPMVMEDYETNDGYHYLLLDWQIPKYALPLVMLVLFQRFYGPLKAQNHFTETQILEVKKQLDSNELSLKKAQLKYDQEMKQIQSQLYTLREDLNVLSYLTDSDPMELNNLKLSIHGLESSKIQVEQVYLATKKKVEDQTQQLLCKLEQLETEGMISIDFHQLLCPMMPGSTPTSKLVWSINSNYSFSEPVLVKEKLFSNASDPRSGWNYCHLLEGPRYAPRSNMNFKLSAYLGYMFCLKSLMKPERPCAQEDSLSFTPPKSIQSFEIQRIFDESGLSPAIISSEVVLKEKVLEAIEYLNQYLIHVVEGKQVFGLVKFKDGRPSFDFKSDEDLKKEFAHLKVSYVINSNGNGNGNNSREVICLDDNDDDNNNNSDTHNRSRSRSRPKQKFQKQPFTSTTKTNTTSTKKISLIQQWLEHPDHNRFSCQKWAPWPISWPSSHIVFPEHALNTYVGYQESLENLAREFILCPKESLHLLLVMIYNNLCSCSDEHYQYLIKYLAHLLQHPFQKTGVFLMLFGASGIGKGVLMQCLGTVLGSMMYHNKSIDVSRKFNDEFHGKSLLFFDELVLNDESYNWLKTAVTEKSQRTEQKFRKAEDTQSFWNCVGASNQNELGKINMNATDRRFYFPECLKTKSQPHLELAKKVGELSELQSCQLRKAFCFFLLNVDISDFDPTKFPSSSTLGQTQLSSTANMVHHFFVHCLQTQTILPSPGYDFLKFVGSSTTTNTPLTTTKKKKTTTEFNNITFNPLMLVDPLMLEKWRTWCLNHYRNYYVDSSTWEFIQQEFMQQEFMHQQEVEFIQDKHLHFHSHNNDNNSHWMSKGGWLRIVPVEQLFYWFKSWCLSYLSSSSVSSASSSSTSSPSTKSKSISNTTKPSSWTLSEFKQAIREIVPSGSLRVKEILNTKKEFFYLPDLDTCYKYFEENYGFLLPKDSQWSSIREIKKQVPIVNMMLDCSDVLLVKLQQKSKSMAIIGEFGFQMIQKMEAIKDHQLNPQQVWDISNNDSNDDSSTSSDDSNVVTDEMLVMKVENSNLRKKNNDLEDQCRRLSTELTQLEAKVQEYDRLDERVKELESLWQKEQEETFVLQNVNDSLKRKLKEVEQELSVIEQQQVPHKQQKMTTTTTTTEVSILSSSTLSSSSSSSSSTQPISSPLSLSWFDSPVCSSSQSSNQSGSTTESMTPSPTSTTPNSIADTYAYAYGYATQEEKKMTTDNNNNDNDNSDFYGCDDLVKLSDLFESDSDEGEGADDNNSC